MEVEAFALRAEDLKFVANQFRRLHSRKLQHTFRFYSHQWRTWSACFIHAAWRRYKKRKLAAQLLQIESSCHSQKKEFEICCTPATSVDDCNADGKGITATAMAEVQAAQKNPRILESQRERAMSFHDASFRMPKLQKPAEPDFSADAEY